MSNIQKSDNELMNNDLAEKLEQQRSTIKNTVAKDATDDELDMFMHLAKQYGLDPFQGEIYFWKYGSKDPTIMTSRDGYLKIANQHKQFDGMLSDVVHENDEFKKEKNNQIKHNYNLGNRGRIVGAYAVVHRKDRKIPQYVFAPYNEYKKNKKVWNQYPSAMILKCAESMALKRAFSVSGLVSKEEMGYEQDSQQPQEKATVHVNRGDGQHEMRGATEETKETFDQVMEQREQKQDIIDEFAEIINDDAEILNADVVKDTAEQKFDTRDIGKLELEQLQELKETLLTDDPEEDDVIDVTPDEELTEQDKQDIEESMKEDGTGK